MQFLGTHNLFGMVNRTSYSTNVMHTHITPTNERRQFNRLYFDALRINLILFFENVFHYNLFARNLYHHPVYMPNWSIDAHKKRYFALVASSIFHDMCNNKAASVFFFFSVCVLSKNNWCFSFVYSIQNTQFTRTVWTLLNLLFLLSIKSLTHRHYNVNSFCP